MDACAHPSVGVTWNSNDTDVSDGSIAASFALLQPFIRCCHITDIGVTAPAGAAVPSAPAAAPYPYRELFARLAETGFSGLHALRVPAPGAGRGGRRLARARTGGAGRSCGGPPEAVPCTGTSAVRPIAPEIRSRSFSTPAANPRRAATGRPSRKKIT